MLLCRGDHFPGALVGQRGFFDGLCREGAVRALCAAQGVVGYDAVVVGGVGGQALQRDGEGGRFFAFARFCFFCGGGALAVCGARAVLEAEPAWQAVGVQLR